MDTSARFWLFVPFIPPLLVASAVGFGEPLDNEKDSADTDPNSWSGAMAQEFSRAEPQDIRRWEPVGEFARPADRPKAGVLFTPDSRHLVIFGRDERTGQGTIDFWEVPGRKLLKTLREPKEVAAVAFSPDGKRMVTAGWDKHLRIYAGTDWELKHSFKNDPTTVTAYQLVLLADGKHFVAGNGSYGEPCIWDLERRQATGLGGRRKELFKGLASSKDGKRVVIAFSAPVAEVWDTEKRKLAGRLELAKTKERQGVFTSVAFGPDDKLIATASYGSTTDPRKPLVTVWDAKTFKSLCETEATEYYPQDLAYSGDGKLLVACVDLGPFKRGLVYVWEAATGKKLDRFEAGTTEGGIRLTLSPDSRWLVTSSADGVTRLWNFEAIRRGLRKE